MSLNSTTLIIVLRSEKSSAAVEKSGLLLIRNSSDMWAHFIATLLIFVFTRNVDDLFVETMTGRKRIVCFKMGVVFP